MEQKKRKLLMFGICFLLFMGLTAVEAGAKEPVVGIVREDGISVLIREGELYYTNEPLRFFLYKEPEEEAVCEYALSGDDGAHYSDWTQMEANGYTLMPDLSNETQGIWQIKFRKTVTVKKEGSVSQNEVKEEAGGEETAESETEVKITESPPYRIGFDLCPPDCSLLSEQEFTAWSPKDISCCLTVMEDQSGIRSILAKTDGETLYEKDFLQSEAMREIGTELVLNKEARNADGLLLDITVTDHAGNTQTITKSYYIDKTRPTVRLSGIENGVMQKEPITVLAEAQDNHQADVRLICQAIRTEADGRQFIEEQTVNGALLERYCQEDGSYEILCYAMDPAGNRSDAAKVGFRIDGTPPFIRLEGVSGGTDYQEGRSVSVSVEEAFFADCYVDICVKRYTPGHEETVFLPSWKAQGISSANSYYFEEDGDYIISVRAADAAGNETGREVRFRVDRHAPALFIRGLSEKTVTNLPPKLILRIGELFYDTAEIRCQLIRKSGNGAYVPVGMPAWRLEKEETEFPLEIREEGSYALRAIATDRAGNRTEEQLYFTLDYTPPMIGYLDALHQKYLKSFRLPADFLTKISDLSGVSYKAYLNMRNFLPQEEVTQDGKYILRVEAVDEAGNTAEKTIAFIVDRTAPRVVVNGMRRDGTVGKNEEITLCLYDGEDTFTSVLLNGVSQTLDEEKKQAVLSFEEYGEHKITVKATDPAQNEMTQVISLSCALTANPFANYQVKERTVKQEGLPVNGAVADPWPMPSQMAAAAAIVLILVWAGILFYRKRIFLQGAD